VVQGKDKKTGTVRTGAAKRNPRKEKETFLQITKKKAMYFREAKRMFYKKKGARGATDTVPSFWGVDEMGDLFFSSTSKREKNGQYSPLLGTNVAPSCKGKKDLE